MGCFQSKEADAAGALGAGGAAALQLGAGKEQEVTALRRAVWKADPPMTAAELQVQSGGVCVRLAEWRVREGVVTEAGRGGCEQRGKWRRAHTSTLYNKPPPQHAHQQPNNRTNGQRKRDEFWDTQPHYGGAREIWDALRAAAALDAATARAVLDAAEVKVMRRDMSVSYDARGFRYELPNYVLSDPTNLLP